MFIVYLLNIIFDTSGLYGSYSVIQWEYFIQRSKLSQNVKFGAVFDIFYGHKEDEILVACNLNQQYFYKKIDYFYKMHIHISCHFLSPNNVFLRWYLKA